MDITLAHMVILSGLGLLAGLINTLAGGGSNLTVPALMVFGMPADVANATNRVGVIVQAIVGVRGFKKHQKLNTQDLKAITIPILLGAVAGASFASYAPERLLKYLLLGAMVIVAAIILLRPAVLSPEPDEKIIAVAAKPRVFYWLIAAGFYGGFVQAGVGFITITILTGMLRYDLIASNALKVLTTVFFTAISLAIFIANDQVRWLPGFILASGNMVGAYIGVKMALNISPKTLKWFLFVMTVAASIAAL